MVWFTPPVPLTQEPGPSDHGALDSKTHFSDRFRPWQGWFAMHIRLWIGAATFCDRIATPFELPHATTGRVCRRNGTDFLDISWLSAHV